MRRFRVRRDSLTRDVQGAGDLPSVASRARKEAYEELRQDAAIPSNFGSQESGPSIRIAVFRSVGESPETTDVASGDARELVRRVVALVQSAVGSLGGSVTPEAIREVVANLVHARFRGASVSVLDGGNEVVVADHGGGIADEELAIRPGFSTASDELRRTIRGVGSGLSVAAESMARAHGEMVVGRNLGGGTVITLRGARARARGAEPTETAADEQAAARGRGTQIELPPRTMQALLVMADGREFGPSEIAQLVGCSLTSAHRDLTRLEQDGLVSYTSRGKRTISLTGREYVAAVLDGSSASHV